MFPRAAVVLHGRALGTLPSSLYTRAPTGGGREIREPKNGVRGADRINDEQRDGNPIKRENIQQLRLDADAPKPRPRRVRRIILHI